MKNDRPDSQVPAKEGDSLVRLGEIGLMGFPPYLMNRIMGRYNAAIRKEMAALGLTTPKLRTLAVLTVMDGIMIREVAMHTIVEQSTLSRAIDQLEEDGLVRREKDESDHRGVRVYITGAGRAAFDSLWPHMAKAFSNMVSGVTPEEKRILVSTLQKLLLNVREKDI